MRKHLGRWLAGVVMLILPTGVFADERTSPVGEDDEEVDMLPAVHVHGVRLDPDRQRGPVPRHMPWPVIPASLIGEELDEWMTVRFLVDPDGRATLMVLDPAPHRALTLASVSALQQWTFLPQLDGETPVKGELTVRIHFRTR